MTKHTLFVCTCCSFSTTEREHLGKSGGAHLLEQVSNLYQTWDLQSEFVVQEVSCLSVCSRPCSVAFVAPNKTTLVFGDLPPLESAADLLQLGAQYHSSSDGIVSWKERPEVLKNGLIAKVPPLTG
jgi:predicted metal-binding protein